MKRTETIHGTHSAFCAVHPSFSVTHDNTCARGNGVTDRGKLADTEMILLGRILYKEMRVGGGA